LLANLTTAIGLISLSYSNILPIRKFGIFSAIGVMATLSLLYLFLPSALTVFPPDSKFFAGASKKLNIRISNMWAKIGSFIIRRHWYVNAALFGGMILMAFGVAKIQTTVQLLKLFDPNSQIIKDYAWLEDNFGRLVPMEVVVRFPEDLHAPVEDVTELTVEDQRLARTKLTMLERAEAVRRIQDVLQDRFGYNGLNIIGRGISGVTFIRDLPQPSSTYSPSRSGANNMLLSSRHELLRSDYVALEKSPVAKNSELWRISLRLGALNDVDYGQFVNSLRAEVEPIVAAYRCRSEIMKSVVAGDNDKVKGLVLVLGHSEPALVDSAKASADPIQPTDLELFASTLRSALINNSISKVLWHNPEHTPLKDGRATSEEWAKYLSKFDSVVLLNHHDDYHLEFVKQNSRNFLDASELLDQLHIAGGQDTEISTPVEMSSFPGQLDVIYTGIVPVVYKAQRTLLESLIQSVIGSFVLIGLVMVVLLSPSRTILGAFAPVGMIRAVCCGFISMIPNVFPLVMVFGFMGHIGALVDIGTMMTASVAMGIAVDDTIHFLTWFRIYLRKGLDRRDAILAAYKDVAPAMTQTTIIGGLGLSVFALSTFTPTQRFGTLMLFLLTVALIGDLVFLPALLSSPLGRLFSLSKSKKSDQDETPDGPAEELPLQDEDEYRLAGDSASAVGQPKNSLTPSSANGDSKSPDNLSTNTAVPKPNLLNPNRARMRGQGNSN
jgi:uncharacterized protein